MVGFRRVPGSRSRSFHDAGSNCGSLSVFEPEERSRLSNTSSDPIGLVRGSGTGALVTGELFPLCLPFEPPGVVGPPAEVDVAVRIRDGFGGGSLKSPSAMVCRLGNQRSKGGANA